MSGTVLGATISLDLHQAAPAHLTVQLAHQQLAEELPGHLQRVANEELRAEQPAGRMRF